MPTNSLRCLVEIDIRAVTSPGTWLNNREDVYLAISLFGQHRRTRLTAAIFPLLFHDTLRFEKIFYAAYEPSQLTDCLEDLTVKVELIQLSDVFIDGRVLAWYHSTAREFLYPYPTYAPTYGFHEREILLERSTTFPGISPRLEFSTKTIIQDSLLPLLQPWDLADELDDPDESLIRSRSRTRSRSRSRSPGYVRGYARPTVSSMYRSRSVSPGRRVELTTRKPSVTSATNRGRSTERKQHKSLPNSHEYSSDDGEDSGTEYGSRSRSISPTRYLSYTERPWTPFQADLIEERLEREIARNRSLDRLNLSLERLHSLNRYRPYRFWPYYHPYYFDTLDDLELDLELARRGLYI